MISTRYIWLLILTLTFGLMGWSQNNVGIGTRTPHPSALLEVNDSARGVIIPQTDTAAVAAYVNSLTPSPGIADGLIIFDVNLRGYVFYDANLGIWKELMSLVGPTGPIGLTGPTGITGMTGAPTTWRDTVTEPGGLGPDDRCDDWILYEPDGVMWYVECDSGGLNPRWVDTVSVANNVAIIKAPDVRVEAFTMEIPVGTNPGIEVMPLGGSTINDDINWRTIPGLTYTFNVNTDEIAYIMVHLWGTTKKTLAGTDYNYAQYDIEISTAPTVGPDGRSYLNRQMGNIITVKNNKPNPVAGDDGLFDLAGWSVFETYVVSAELTPQPCNVHPGCGPTGCPPCPSPSSTFTIQAYAGHRYSATGNGPLTLYATGTGNSETPAHMSIFAVIRRNPLAIDFRK